MTAAERETQNERQHRVVVQPLPRWLDSARLLGPQAFSYTPLTDDAVQAEALLPRSEAADLAARLRGLGFAGQALQVNITPPLSRTVIRAARSADARRRWNASEGFADSRARLDTEGRISLTPEALAMHLAQAAAGLSVVDACCGAGGNAIAFARANCKVTAIDADAERLTLAKHNAHLYGVEPRIEFVHADANSMLAQLQADLLFLDVPWGADWNRKITTLADLPLLPALLTHRSRYKHVWLKVPPSFATRELADFEPKAIFGTGTGDSRRVKFLWLRSQ